MKLNMGSEDRLLRSLVVAPATTAIAVLVGATSVAGIVLLVVAAIMLATAAIGFCPLYRLLRIDTRLLGRSRSAHSG
jgi:hypothetical protein